MAKLNIFPKPVKAEEQPGQFYFFENETLYFVLPVGFRNQDFLDRCPTLWKNFTAGKSTLKIILREGIKTACLAKSADLSQSLALTEDYEYILSVTEDCILIAHDTERGLIHGFVTLLQLLSPYSLQNHDFSVNCITVYDKPMLGFRALHLCVFPETTLHFLEKAVNLCGFLKCTHIVIEFWGMFRFRFMPELSWSDAYTAEDIQPVLKAGRSLGVEFIPMFNHMGHATQSRFKAGKNVLLDNAPEYEEYFEPSGWTWNVRKPEVIELLKNTRRELCEAFGAGEYFHIGCDEVYFADQTDDGFDKEQNDLFVEFVNSTAADLAASGRKTLMWGDMFLDKFKFRPPYCSNTSCRCYDYDRNIARIDPAVNIVDWQYNIGKDMDGTVKYFAEHRDPQTVILSPWEGSNGVSSEDHILGRAVLAREYGMKGLLATTWNTIYNDPRNLIYAVCQMWSEDEIYMKLRTWESYKCMGMAYLRKLMPCGGKRELSGWWPGELHSPSI